MKKFLDFNLRWSLLAVFGENRLVKSNYIWLFAVPIFVKILIYINSNYGLDIDFNQRLKHLFIASLFFALGTLMYTIRRPAFITDYKSLSEFTSDLKTPQHVVDYYQEEERKIFSTVNLEQLKQILATVTCESHAGEREVVYIKAENANDNAFFVDDIKLAKFFWDTRSVLDASDPYYRLCVGALYVLGFIFLFWLTLVNIILSFKELF